MTKPKKPAAKPAAKSKPKAPAKAPVKAAPKPAPVAAKKAAPAKPAATPAPAKPAPVAVAREPDEAAKAIMLNARKRKSTPAIFKIRSRKNTPIVFTLDDVRELIKSRKQEKEKTGKKADTKPGLPVARFSERIPPAKGKTVPAAAVKPAKAKVLGAASLADILGVTAPPKTHKPVSVTQMMDQENIPQKYRRYYRQLVEMREEIRQGLDLHAQETLKRSAKEDSGDLSGYSQHMADAGTDTFDRDFALSLVSSEQELLFEIEEALKRIRNGTYGTCEITGQAISAERLAAVPFTRYSLEGQKELEKQRRYGSQRGNAVAGLFTEATGEDAAALAEDDSDAS
ncbi:MAG TPA: TraR/DksA C4-type zinc finger protein [Opitutales bacterium]|nr:TraR/DksA C4-type zinc finger protein [Opitutales bacterium]